MKALVVKPGETTGELREVDGPVLAGLQEIVGGYIEGIYGRGWHAWVNEEGKIMNLDVNRGATRVAYELGWPVLDIIAGPAVFVGDDPEGDDGDVPEFVLKVARTYLEITEK